MDWIFVGALALIAVACFSYSAVRKYRLFQKRLENPYGCCVFLDFDGVLHPGFDETFIHIPKINRFLKRNPHVSVVISSSWREGRELESLKLMFDKSIRDQIIGETPVLTALNRQAEIEQFCKLNKVGQYIILDDDERLFGFDCKNLYMVNHHTGLTGSDFSSLYGWARRAARGL
tara:strand:- start:2210 stop:2734 length:525 start_codon:yes stop_codon:yes gene_type:complete